MVNELKQALSAWGLIRINFQEMSNFSLPLILITFQVASNHNNGLAD